MNQTHVERWLLLEQTGELSARQRRQLAAALAASSVARRGRAELCGLAAAIPPVTAQPAADAVPRIAARLRARQKPSLTFPPAWKPALAAVAALALLVGLRVFRYQPGGYGGSAVAAVAEEEDWTDPLEAEFAELENLISGFDSDEPFGITEL